VDSEQQRRLIEAAERALCDLKAILGDGTGRAVDLRGHGTLGVTGVTLGTAVERSTALPVSVVRPVATTTPAVVTTHVSVKAHHPATRANWPDAAVVTVLLVYWLCALDATIVWPWVKEPLETAEARLAFVLAVLAYWDQRRHR
jgi:hypothetical protein